VDGRNKQRNWPYAALRSITQHYAALRSITQHYAALRSITQHYAALTDRFLTELESIHCAVRFESLRKTETFGPQRVEYSVISTSSSKRH